MMPPFQEDCGACAIAESLGLSLSRRDVVDIADLAAIKAAGLMRECPDYSRIRKLLADGVEVPGATMGGAVEYILRRLA